MNFSIYSYAFAGLIMPGLFVFFLFTVAFLFSKHLAKKKYSAAVVVSPLGCALAIFMFLLFCLSYGYRYPLSAVFQYNCDRYITTGYVDSITNAPALPVYYDNTSHAWSSGELLTINGERYYIPFGTVKVGDAIELLWGTDERVVYEYSVKVSFGKDEIGTRLVSNNTANQSDTEAEKTGQRISTISFVVLIIFVLLLFTTQNKLSDYLVKKDKETIQKIIPNKVGLYIFGFFLLLLGVTIGLALTGFEEALLIFSIVFCGWIVSSIKKLHTELIIKKNSVVVKKCKLEKVFCREDILNVSFIASRLPYNRCLVITFQNKQQIVLDQISFWGLSNAYQELSAVEGPCEKTDADTLPYPDKPE